MGAWLASCSTYVDNSSQCITVKTPWAEFLSLGSKHYCSVLRLPLRLPSSINHNAASCPFSAVLVFFPLFSCMPADIIPSASTTQPTTTTSSQSSSASSSINAQFINAVTRGDESYARSLLARGADVNATDAMGRSAVACAVAGERCAERAGRSRSRACMEVRC